MAMGNDRDGNQMRVTVKKERLIEILTTNRAKHLADFEEASKVYREKILKRIDDIRDELRVFYAAFEAGKADETQYPSTGLYLPKPESYVAHYDRALGMLNLHTGTEMVLDLDSYRKFVDDEWDWSHEAKAIAASYMSG